MLPSESNIETKPELTTEPETAAPIEQQKKSSQVHKWLDFSMSNT
ncbi:hypothetical protein MKY15_04240 [Sporosarcina sp. FSL K6-1540]|nr:hypothetical protein [Sporosarcina sp. resist]